MNKILNRFLLLTSILLFVACNSNIKTNKEAKIMNKNDKETAFLLILNHPELQQYFHEEEDNRIPIKVQTNETLGTDMSITKFDKLVEFYGSNETKNLTPIFEVTQFDFKENRVIFNILYNIEGITIKGKLSKENEWKIVEFDVSES